jgi:hypothetical protein
MMPRVLATAVAIFAIGFGPSPAVGQASACRPADAVSDRIIRWVTHVVTGTDDASTQQRNQMALPQVSASQISYVTDKTVCSKVLSPYNANSTMQEAATGAPVLPSGQVYVVKVGTVYVVNDPVKTAGEFTIYVTLDAKYKVLATSLG